MQWAKTMHRMILRCIPHLFSSLQVSVSGVLTKYMATSSSAKASARLAAAASCSSLDSTRTCSACARSVAPPLVDNKGSAIFGIDKVAMADLVLAMLNSKWSGRQFVCNVFESYEQMPREFESFPHKRSPTTRMTQREDTCSGTMCTHGSYRERE